jgi:DNA polymerase
MKLWLDTETFSTIPITHGTEKYSEEVEVMIVTWAVDDGPVRCWDVTAEPVPPPALVAAMSDAAEVWAHNSYFDRTVIRKHKPGWALKDMVPLTIWRCVMAKALAHGLPGKLDKLCEIFKLNEDEAKGKRGKELINLFCKPRAKRKDGIVRATRETHPAEWAEFLEYAKQDIVSMRVIDGKLPNWNYGGPSAAARMETSLWHLDQRINDRGVEADIDLAQHAVRACLAEQKVLGDRTMELTNGTVQRTTQRDLLLGYLLLEYGVELPDMRADTLERRLEDPELPEYVKELLRIRLQASKSSTSKYKRVVDVQVRGRLYGLLQFCGAQRTGRWAGRNFQPQNLPRLVRELVAAWCGISIEDLRKHHIVMYLDAAVAALKCEAEDVVFDNIMGMTSNAIRGVLVAAKGKKLVISDLANIEGRGLAGIAGEQWKLDAFAAYDRGEGSDLYKVSYARSFDIQPEEVDDEGRQIGKVQELALGYEGGVGAFATMAMTYGLDLDAMAKAAYDTLPLNIRQDAQGMWTWAKKKNRTLGLAESTYVVCEALKRMWRDAHPATVQFWKDIQHAVTMAILHPGQKFPVQGIVVERAATWLRIRLPSGRSLCYPSIRLEGGSISYLGVNQYTRRWARLSTYSGKLTENIVQAWARDVMADGMVRAEAEGYPIVLTVHDELITETPDTDDFTDEGLSRILASNPSWARGVPLAAKGFTTYRYRKD